MNTNSSTLDALLTRGMAKNAAIARISILKTLLAALVLILGLSGLAWAQTQTDSFTNTGSASWTVPPGVTSITVEAWGGGGGGGKANTGGNDAGAGGGGGGYASGTFSVTPGNTLNLFVGTGGTAASAGQGSWFVDNTTLLAAGGGAGGAGNSTGSSGSANIGSLQSYQGGAGAAGESGGSPGGRRGGGGGGSALQNSAGGAGQAGSSGGAGGIGFGNGGSGTQGTTNGNAGLIPGGGGGGGGNGSVGGSGARGEIHITYVEAPPAVATSISLSLDGPPGTPGGQATVLVEVANIGALDATGAIASLDLGDGLVVDSVSGDGVFDTPSGEWQIGSLASGATASLELIVDLLSTGDYTVDAVVSSDQDGGNTAFLIAGTADDGPDPGDPSPGGPGPPSASPPGPLTWHDSDQKTATGSGTAVSVPRPDNVSEGDLIILIFSQQRSYLDSRTGFSQPAGFRLIRSSHRYAYQAQNTTQVGSTESPETVAYYKIAGPSEPATYTSTVINHGSDPNWKVVAGRVTGHDPIQPIGRRSSIDSGTTAVSSQVLPAIQSTGENSLLIGARTVRRAIDAAPPVPTGMTLLSHQNGTGTADANANAPALQVASQNLGGFGIDIGSRTFSWTGGTARASALMFEIRAFQLPSVPRINGLYYAKGDNLRYPALPYAVSTSGSEMFTQYVDGILYVALVVSRNVNDNVFDSSLTDYMTNGDWTQSPTTAGHRVNSEFAEFRLTVGSQVFNWYMGYGGQRGGGSPESRNDRRADIWRADHTVSGGSLTPPPGTIMESSFAWNMNNYARRWQTGTNTWVMPGIDTNSGDWKSPWLGADNPPNYTFPGTPDTNTVVNPAEGYPATGPITYSQTYEYEWPMVYEWAVDLRQFGESPSYVVAGRSHHSPRKDDPIETEDPFEEPPGGNPALLDFGDLPDGDLPGPTYPTLLANDGPRHVIDPGGTLLGTSLDSEPDGLPDPQALGDDSSGVDDEDGIIFLTPFVPGSSALVQVTVGNTGGHLSGWIDFNGDGTLTQVNVTDVDGPATVDPGLLGDLHFPDPGVYTLTIDVPSFSIDDPTAYTGLMPSRWRITNNEDEGGNSITGEASSGEVEDYMIAQFGDRVWHDVNGNGIQDGGEPGLAGVTVRLLDASGNPVLDGNGNAVTTITDSNGNYSFSVPPNVQYRAEVVPPTGYVVTAQNADSQGLTGPANSDFSQSTGQTNTFSLTQGQSVTYVDAGLYIPATIGDFVWNDLNGNGIQDSGEPGIEGVTVTLTGTDGAGNAVNLTTTTDSDGFYEFTGLAPGTYTVTFTSPTGYVFTAQNADGNGLTGPVNSDANTTTGAAAPVTVASGDNVTYIDAGLYIPASIGDFVWIDANGNGIQDLVETGLNGVTVNLTGTDGLGNPVNLSTTTADDGNGDPGYYLFSGLVPGSYTVTFVAPGGYVFTSQVGVLSDTDNSDADPVTGQTVQVSLVSGDAVTYVDAGLYQPVSIGDFVWVDANGNGIQDVGEDGLEGVTVNLLDGSGAPVLDGNGDEITTTTDSNGAYSFTGLAPGSYSVSFELPDGYVFTTQDADGLGVNGLLNSDADPATGATPSVTLASGETNNNLDAGLYKQSCPDTWAAWQDKWDGRLDGLTGLTENPDGDRYSNLIEYAFCLPPHLGIMKPFCLNPSVTHNGAIDGVYRRTAIGGAKDVTYVLEWTASLANPTTWPGSEVLLDSDPAISVENDGEGGEIVTIANLEDFTGLTGGSGFVRIRVDFDDGNETATDTTDVLGWVQTDFDTCCTTYCNPFLECAVFTGTVDSVDAQDLLFTNSTAGFDPNMTLGLAGVLDAGVAYYIEVETGALAGHRFDIESAGFNSLTLPSDSDIFSLLPPFNTVDGAAPSDLVGSRIAVHLAKTLDMLFPPTGFFATSSQTTADEVQVNVGGVWKIYWLCNEINGSLVPPRWADAADAGNDDQGATVIPPGRGMFFNNRSGLEVGLLAFGEVREQPFANPLAAGNNLVGGGYPVDQTPVGDNSRQLNLADGFFGSRDFKSADSVFRWRSDVNSLATGYDSYFLLSNTSPFALKWVLQNDATRVSQDSAIIFERDRSVFQRVRDGVDDYLIPAPWTPDAVVIP